MATEADIPETIFVKKKEEEDKELTSECLNTTVNEISQEGMNKVEPWHNQTPETIKFLEKSADMQVATKTEVQNVNAVIEGNVETIEGEFFLASPLVTKVAREETSRVAEDYQAAEKPTQAEKEVPKNETIREDKLENQNVEIVENKEASLEEFKWNTDKELRSSEKDEKGVTMTEEKTDFESNKQTLDMLEASSGQNAGALVQTPDLTEDKNMDSGKLKEAYDKEDSIDNAFSTKTTSTEENIRETSFQGGAEKEPEASFHSMSKEMNLEAIQPTKNIENKKNEGEEMPHEATKDVCISTETASPDNQKEEEETENCTGPNDKTGSPLVTTPIDEMSSENARLDVGGKLEENSSIAFEERSHEAVEPIKKMRSMTFIQDEIQDVPETGSEGIAKERQNESQIEIPENTVIADSSLSRTYEDCGNPEPKVDGSFTKHEDSSHKEGQELAPEEASTVEYGDDGLSVIVEDNIEAAEHSKSKMSEHRKHPEHSFLPENEPGKEKLENSLDMASEKIESTASNEHAETNTQVEEQRPIEGPEDILDETRKGEAINADDINKKEIPEEKNIATVYLSEQTESAEVEIPNKNANDLYVTNPQVEVPVQTEGEKLDKVPTSVLDEQIQEADVVPIEENTDVNEAYEARNRLKSDNLDQTASEGKVPGELTSGVREMEVDRLAKVEMDSEEKLQVKDAANNTKEEMQLEEEVTDTELQSITTKGDHEKRNTDEDVPVKGSNTICSGEGADGQNLQENENGTNNSEATASELNDGDRCYEVNNETDNNDRDINKEVYENRNIDDMNECAEKQIKEEETVTDHSPESTAEETTRDFQEDKMETEKHKAEMEEELGTTNTCEGIEKKVTATEKRIQQQSMASIEEETIAEISKDEMTAMMLKQEVHGTLQKSEGAYIGLQIKEEDCTAKDNFAESVEEEETKKDCCHVEEKQHDIEASEGYETAGASTNTENQNIEESVIIDLHSLTDEENLKGDEREIIKSKDEVKNLKMESQEKNLETTNLTEERKLEATKDEAKPNENCNAQSIAGTSEEEILPEESNEDIAESSSTAPEVSEKDIKEEISQKAESIQETSFTSEKSTVTIETGETRSNSVDIIAKPEEMSNSIENKDMVNPTGKHGADDAREEIEREMQNETHCTLPKSGDQIEVSTDETPSNDISGQNLESSLTVSLEKHNLVTTEASETKKETTERHGTSNANEEAPSVSETTEEKLMQNEKSTDSIYGADMAHMGSVDIEKDLANKEVQDAEQELNMPLELNNEKGTSESDAELLKREQSSEVADGSEIGKKYEKALGIELEKDKFEDPVNEGSKCAEACETCTDTEVEAGSYSHGSEASDIRSISTSTEEVSAEVDRAEENENIKERKIEGESCTKEELHMISGGTVHEVKDPELELPEHLETTGSKKDTETVRSKDEEDINWESEASAMTKTCFEEELKKANENPVDVSSSVPDGIEEKIKEEEVEETDNCNDKTDAAAKVVTKETSLEEIQQDDKSVKASDTSSETRILETIQTTEPSLQDEEIDSVKLAGTSQMVHQLPKIEHGNLEKGSTNLKNSDADEDVETKILDAVSECKDQCVEGTHEPATRLAERNTDTDEIEEEIKKVPEPISEPEALTDGEVTSNQTLQAEKLEDETETIKEKIIDGESCTKGHHMISGGTVNEVKDPELKPPQNLETTDSNKDTERVRSKDEEDLNWESEVPAITKAFSEEELKKDSEKPVDVSSPVPEEIDEKIEEEKLEAADKNDAAATVVTKETSMGDIQQDDKSVKAPETSPDSETPATIQTIESSLHGEENASMNLEETSHMVYRLPKIEETPYKADTSLPVGNTATDEIEEEIKKVPEPISEPRYNNVEALTDGEVTSNQTLPAAKLEDEFQTIKENILDVESCTMELHMISGGTVNEVKDTEQKRPENLETTDSNKDTETVRSKDEEDFNWESEVPAITKSFSEEELMKASGRHVDVSSPVPEEIDEKIEEENLEEADKTDAAATVVTKETSLGEIQQDDKSVKAFDTSPDSETLATIQMTESSQQGGENASMKLEETTQMVYDKLISGGTVNEVKDTELKPPENLETTDSNKDAETVRSKDEEDLSWESEVLVITKAFSEEELKKASEKHVDVSSPVPEVIDEKIEEENLEEADKTDAAATVVTKETSLGEIQQDDKSVKAIDTSLDSETLATIQMTESSLQGEENASRKLEETSQMVYQLPNIEETPHEAVTSLPVRNTATDELEEEIKNVPEAISGPRYNNIEAVTDGEDISNQTLAEKLEDETETIKENIIDGQSCTKELHMISGGIVNEVKDTELKPPENLETTDPNKDTETVRSKDEEDLNWESEVPAITKAFSEEKLMKAIERPVDVSSSVPEKMDEKIEEEKLEEADKTDAAAKLVTKETSLGEIQQDDKSVKAFDTSPDLETLATIQTTESSLQGEENASMKLEETSQMVYQLPNIEETPHEGGTSLPVRNTATDEIEEENKKVPEAISGPRYNNIQAVSVGEVISNQTLPAEKLEDETETIKENIIDGESCTKEHHMISGGIVNEVKDTELKPHENLETTDSNKDTETVRSKDEEDLNWESEVPAITKSFSEEELKKASEKPVDVLSSVPEEIDEKIEEEKLEETDKTDAAAKLVTKETSLGEIQQYDKSVNAFDTSPDMETLATIQTTESSLQGEENASMKLEETSQMVYQLPNIEETPHEAGTSLPIGNTATDEIEEEIKKVPESISGPRYNNIEAVTDGEVISNQTLPAEKLEDETETIKEKIVDGESCTMGLHMISGGTVNKVKDTQLKTPENLETTDSNKDTETVRSKDEEDLNWESEVHAITKAFSEEELMKVSEKPVDVSSPVPEEIEEKIKEEKVEVADNTDAAATVVTKETSLGEIQQYDRSVKAFDTSPDSEAPATIQTTESSLQGEENASMKLEETSQMVYQLPNIEETPREAGTSIPVGNTATDDIEEELKKVPEAISGPGYNNIEAVTDGEVISNQTLPAEKLEDETETIKEKIVDGESCSTELHMISGGTVHEVKDPEQEPPENLETTDSNKDTETVGSEVEENPNWESEPSAITKAFSEEELKIATEKPVDVSSSVPEEVEEKIKEEKVEVADNTDAAATVVRKETSLGEIQQYDRSVKAFDTSPDSEAPATIQTTESSLQGEENASMKLEETSQMVYQLPNIEEAPREAGTSLLVGNTATDDIEEELKKVPEAISGPGYNNIEAVTDGEVISNQTLPAEKLEDETETIKEKIVDGESCSTDLHMISGGTVHEVKDPELEPPENLETTDSNKDTETVGSEVEENPNWESEPSAITKAFSEEELKIATEMPMDVSSSVPEEVEENIKEEKVEVADNTDAAATVVTKETSLGEIQRDDKSVKAFDTSPDSEAPATIQTTESSLQGEENASMKLEETSQMVYQLPNIEETPREAGTSLPVENTATEDIEEELKKVPEAISGPGYNNIEAVTDGEVISNQTLPAQKLEDETETIKEKIVDGESCSTELHMIYGGTVHEVKEPELDPAENLETTDSNKDTETVGSKDEENPNWESEPSAITKAFPEEELKIATENPVDVSSSVPEEVEEKIKEEKVEVADNTDAAATVVTKETSLGETQQYDRSVKAFDTSPDSEAPATIQTTESSLQGEENASMKLEETSQMVYQLPNIEETPREAGTSLPVGNTATDDIEEELKKVPEAISGPDYNNIEAVTDGEVISNQTLPAEKLEDETETIKEKIVDGESCSTDLHMISGGTVHEVKDPELEPPENLETTDSNKDTETVGSEVEENPNWESEPSAITKAFSEEELKIATEMPMDVSSSVPEEVEENIKEEKVEVADNTDAAATVVTKETSLGEIQRDDKSVKAFDTSPDSEAPATIQTTESSLQGEENASMKLEETSQMVYQLPNIEETPREAGTSLPVENTATEDIEEELKKVPEAISGPGYNNIEAVTDGEVISNQTLPAKKLEDETETIKEKIVDGESCSTDLHMIYGGTVHEVKEPELDPAENLETTDSNKDTETVGSKDEENPNWESEPSAITKAFPEEELKIATENPVDVSSSVPEEVEEKIKEEKVEVADNTDAAATVVTKETSLRETQQYDRSVKAFDTSPDSEAPATIQTTESSLQGEENASMKLEETSQMVYQLPNIEETPREAGTSLPVGNTATDDIEEELKKVPEAISGPDYNNIEAVTDGEVISNQTLPAEKLEDETETIKEKIVDGESCSTDLHMISGGTVHEVKDPELEPSENLETTDSNKDTETVGSEVEENPNWESEPSAITKAFSEEELKIATEMPMDVSSSVPEEVEENIKEEKVEVADNTDAAATVVTKETSLGEIQRDDKSVKAFDTSPDSEAPATIQTTESSLQGEENASMKFEETSQMVYQLPTIEETPREAGTSLPVENTATEDIEELKKVPEAISGPGYNNIEAVTDGEVISNQTLPAQKLEDETETIKEKIVDGESCSTELHMIYGGIVHEVKEPELEPPENLETTDSNKDTETVGSKDEENPNWESEPSAITKAFSEEELKTATENPVDVSSSVPEEVEENIKEEKVEVAENTDAAATVVTKETSLGEIQEGDKSVKASDTTPDSESEGQCVEETCEIGTSLTAGKIDTSETEEEIKNVPETIYEPRYNSIEAGIDGEIDSNQTLPAEKIEEQLLVPSSALLFKEQDHEKMTTIERIEDGRAKNNETELDSMKLEETSGMELLTTEHENADQFSVTGEMSDAAEIKPEQTKIPDSVSESKVQSCEEIHETGRCLAMENIDADETEQEIKEVPATISGTRNQGVESVTNDEMTPDHTLPAENLEEQLQVPYSALLYKEQECETTTTIEKIEDDSTKKEIDSIIIEETSGMVSQLPIMDMSAAVEKLDANELKIEETKTFDAVCESKDQGVEDIYETGTITVEKNDADEMVEEIKEVPEPISKHIYQGVETASDGEISPEQTFPAGEMDEQLLMPPSLLLPEEQEHETTTTMKKIEDESTKKDEAEIGNMKLEESSAMASQLPKIDHEVADNVNVTVETSKADEVEVEETKISIEANDSKDRGVEEIHESETSPTVGKTDIDTIEEIKEVPDIISGPKYQGLEAFTEGGITPEQTLPPGKSEPQHQEPSPVFLFKERDHETTTTTEKIEDDGTKKDHTRVNEDLDEDLDSSSATGTVEETCFQKEKPRELGVSELELKLTEETKKDSPNEPQKEEKTALEGAPAVEPQVYVSEITNADLPSDTEKRYIQCSSQETLKDEDILDSENPNKEADDLPSSHSTVKEILPGEEVEKCEEASNLGFEKTGKVLELVSEVHSPDVLTKPEEMKITEEPLGAATGELRTKDNQSEEITEASETIQNELSSKKIKEADDERVTTSNQEDELRAEEHSGEKKDEKIEITEKGISNKEFDELEKTDVNKNVEEIIVGEDRAVESTYQVSDGDGTASNNLLEEAEEKKNAKREHTDLDIKDQGDETKCRDIAAEATALSEEVDGTEVVLVKPNEDRIGAIDKKIVIRKDEESQNSNLDDLPVRDAAADKRVGEKIEEVPEPAPREPTYKIIKTQEENKETAMANTNNAESIMDNERPQHTSLKWACSGSDAIEGLNLKEQEAYATEQSTLSHTETSRKEMEDKESEKTVDEKQNDLKFDDQKTDEVGIEGGGKNITCERQHRNDEDQVKLSTRGNGSKLDEAEVHNTITAIEGESQVQDEELRLDVLADIKDSIMTISQEDGIVDLAEDNETPKDTPVLKTTTLALSDQHIPRESDANEGIEATISIGNKDVTPVQQDPIAKTFQNAEEDDLKAENASGAEPEEKRVECGEEKRMGDECEEKTEKSTSIESTQISLSELLQGTTKETSQVAKHLTEERELVVNKELQTEKAEIARVEEAKTDDDRDEEVRGEEHKREDSGSDAPVMVEASRDVDVKIVNKKSHNILSGVGSKVKHSIAKVKKVITGKASQCSHPRTQSRQW